MLDHLAPARRRLVLGAAVAVALGVAAALVGVVLGRGPGVEPVAQDDPGPVLLVPGYGGSTASLQVLADAVAESGRETVLVRPDNPTGDLRAQAEDLDRAARAAVDAGAPSVDVVGYSAGGVVARLWVAELGGGSLARRVVTLSSPHHGTDLAALAGQLGSEACPEACRQLDPDSDVLRRLDAGDETPAGPAWFSLWTADDATVVPPSSGALEGAVDVRVQDVCPDLEVGHADVPRTPEVIGIVLAQLGAAAPAVPGSCPAG